jgi:SpoVK/Ycf46/Vps4 family AAA+-type ATPase
MSDAGTSARVFGTFITWLQEKTSPVFVVATANNISILPPELLRKGRFDEIFFVDLPNAVERKEIFKIHLQKRDRDPSLFDLDELANLTKGYSGAEIEQIIISALYDAFDENDEINDQRLHHTISDIIPLSQTMKEELTKLRDWAKSRARKTSIQTEYDEDEIMRKIELD